MTTHTPGPWWMAAASSGSTGYAVGAGDDELFVSLPRPNPGEERANALLARAAPELAKALGVALGLITKHGLAVDLARHGGDDWQRLEAARVALSKIR